MPAEGALSPYRFHLVRHLDQSGPRGLFVMLNPSTADAERDDPTLRRCLDFARRWGWSRLEVVNLFARRATHPGDLRRVQDPVGRGNLRRLRAAIAAADLVVAAWGSHGAFGRADERARRLLAAHPDVRCLGLTRRGQPRHPLYVPRTAPLLPFVP